MVLSTQLEIHFRSILLISIGVCSIFERKKETQSQKDAIFFPVIKCHYFRSRFILLHPSYISKHIWTFLVWFKGVPTFLPNPSLMRSLWIMLTLSWIEFQFALVCLVQFFFSKKLRLWQCWIKEEHHILFHLRLAFLRFCCGIFTVLYSRWNIKYAKHIEYEWSWNSTTFLTLVTNLRKH